MENVAPADINKGLIKTPMKIDHHRSLLDTATCQTFTEVIVTDKEHPYVLGTRLRVNHDRSAEIEIIWTTTGYWGFSADAYLQYSSAEKWEHHSSRQARYARHAGRRRQRLPRCVSRTEKELVPWGYPATAPKAAACTPAEEPPMTAVMSRPSGVNIAQPPLRGGRDDRFGRGRSAPSAPENAAGGSGAPDSHLFRVENGKLRYVHTLTHLLAGEFPGRRGRGRRRWPARRTWRTRRGQGWSGRRSAAEQSRSSYELIQGAARARRRCYFFPRSDGSLAIGNALTAAIDSNAGHASRSPRTDRP